MRLMRLFVVLLLCASHSVLAQNIPQAIQLFNDKKNEEASKIFSSVKSDHKDYHQAQYYLGRISFNKSDLDAAEEYFEEAIENNNAVADYHYWLGNTLGSIAQDANTLKQGMLAPKIKSSYERAVELDPNHLGALSGLIEFYSQAPGFMGGSWEKAEQCAKTIIKINKAEGYRALGNVYARQEKFTEAEQQYISAYKADPAYVQVLIVFYNNQKQFDKVFQLFDELLKKDPENMSIAYQFGKASALSGKHLDAGEMHLTKYLTYTPRQNEPSHAGANMRLAQIKEKRGKKKEANALYQKALLLDKSMKEAQEGFDRTK